MSCSTHDKVYSGEQQITSPPFWVWICRECGAIGADQLAVKPKRQYNKARKLFAKFQAQATESEAGEELPEEYNDGPSAKKKRRGFERYDKYGPEDDDD